MQARIGAAPQQQGLTGLDRFDCHAAVVLAGANVLPVGFVEELVRDRVAKLAGVALQWRVEVDRRTRPGDVDAVPARLVERVDGSQ